MSRNKHLHYELKISNHYDGYEDYKSEGMSDLEETLFSSVKGMDVTKLCRLLDHGVKPNIKDWRQQTPLHVAMQLKPCDVSVEIIRLLIAFGCPVDDCDRFGQTALHEACILAEPDYVPILLEAGSSVNVQDNAGQTPLMVACHMCNVQMLIVVQYLLDYGASVNIRDPSGKNALYYLIVNNKKLTDTTVRSEVVYKLLYADIDVNYKFYQDENLAQNLFVKQSSILSLYDHLHCHFKPLLCAGCQIMEKEDCYSYLVMTLRSLDGTHALNDTLDYLLYIFVPVCSIRTLCNLRNCLKGYNFLKDKPAVLKLDNLVTQVKSLKCISRIAIRKRINNQLFTKVETLDLPTELKEFIKYSECETPILS